MRNAFRKFISDKHGRIAVAQWPNPPLWGWLLFLALSKIFAADSGAHTMFAWLSTASLAVWAVLELFSGVSYFRRTAGALVLLYMVISRLL